METGTPTPGQTPERMTVEREIAEIARRCGLPYMCETLARVNVRLSQFKRDAGGTVSDETGAVRAMPFVVNIQNINGSFVFPNTGNAFDEAQVVLGFCDMMPLDFHGEQITEISERLKSTAVKFIYEMRESGFFDFQSNSAQYAFSYGRLDDCLCICHVSLTVRNNYRMCFDEHRKHEKWQ